MSEHEGNGDLFGNEEEKAKALTNAERQRRWREKQRVEQAAPPNGEHHTSGETHCPECGMVLSPQPPIVQYVFRKDGDIPPIYKQALWAVRISDMPPDPPLEPGWRLWTVWVMESLITIMAILLVALFGGTCVAAHWVAWHLAPSQLPPAWFTIAGVRFYDPVDTTIWIMDSPFAQGVLIAMATLLAIAVIGFLVWKPKPGPEV